MGRAIVYCGDCGKSLTDEDFAKGRARTLENGPYCTACRPLPAGPPAAPIPKKISTTRLPIPPPSTRRAAPAAVRKFPPRLLIGLGLGGAAVLLIAVLVLALPGGGSFESPPPPAPPPTAGTTAPPPRTEPERREVPARPTAEETERLDRFLAEIRAMIRNTARLPDRHAEVEGMLAAAEKTGGPRLAEIRSLRAEFTKALEEARLRREREARLEEILPTIREAIRNVRRLRKRRSEVEDLLNEAEKLAGPRRPEVDALRAECSQAFERAGRFKGLVGHWRLDGDGKDSGPGAFHGIPTGAPRPSEGKIGGAFRFEKDEQVITLPTPIDLDRIQEDSYTLAVWFRTEALPAGSGGEDNYSRYGLLMKAGWHLGLSYNRGGLFFMDHWLSGDKNVGIAAAKPVPPGEWHHVVGVVDLEAGATLIYIDGGLSKKRSWPAGSAPRSYGKVPWRIGQANPGSSTYAWPARGRIDDVRLYDQALSPEEIRTLYQAGAAGRDP